MQDFAWVVGPVAACFASVQIVVFLKGAMSWDYEALANKVLTNIRMNMFCLRREQCLCDVDAFVQQKMQEYRVLRYRTTIQVFTLVLTGILVATAQKTFSDKNLLHSPVQIVTLLVNHFLGLIAQVRSRCITTANVDIWYSVNMLCLSVYMAPFLNPSDTAPLFHNPALVVSVISSLCHMRTSTVGVWTAVHVALISVSEYKVYCCDKSQMTFAILAKVFLGACVVAFAAVLEKAWESQVRYDAHGKLLIWKESAAIAMMNIFYDVVFELDADFVIVNSSADSAARLWHSTGSGLRGEDFRSLLADMEDQEQFTERLSHACCEQQAAAEVMQVTMRQVEGDSFRAELFAFQYAGLDGRPRHLLGLRECSEDLPNALPDFDEASGHAVLSLTFDASKPELPVLSSSEAMNNIVGPHESGCELSTWLLMTHELEQWLQAAASLHADEHQLNRTQVEFRTSTSHGQIKARCRVAEVHGANNGGAEGPLSVRLAFDRLNVARVRSRDRESNLSGSSESSTSSRLNQPTRRGTKSQMCRRDLGAIMTL